MNAGSCWSRRREHAAREYETNKDIDRLSNHVTTTLNFFDECR
jgi:hypothetical protein